MIEFESMPLTDKVRPFGDVKMKEGLREEDIFEDK